VKEPFEGAQALAILRRLGDWLADHPGRTVTVRFDEFGWRVDIRDTRQTSGQSIADALAQAAQTVAFDPGGT
jgi:hypothetical protein